MRPGLIRRWLVPAGGLLAAAALAVLAVRFGGSTSEPEPADLVSGLRLRPLAAAMTFRPTTGRFSSLGYLPPPRVTRSAEPSSSSVPPDVLAAAAEVEEATSGREDWQSRWARGLALVTRGDFDGGLAELDAVRPPGGDSALADALTADRAAAYIGRVDRTGDVASAQRALELSDQLLARDPNSLPGRFNRAVALDHLDRRDAALQAWRDYLARDADSPWGREAGDRARP